MVPPPLRPQPKRQRSLSTTSLSPAPLSPAYSFARQYLSLVDSTEQFSLEREARSAAVQRTKAHREQLAGELRLRRAQLQLAPNDLSLGMKVRELEQEYQRAVEKEEQARTALNSPTIAGQSLLFLSSP
jgi:ParB-like chromosome segregation protein Spo0J